MIDIELKGLGESTARFFQENQLKNRELWKKFVDVFRTHPDSENYGWRGEYWGKMMRGAALVYAYSKDGELYEVMTETVRDLLTAAESDGRVSSYAREKEFDGWDLWSRKYVILGCEYYLEICKDEGLREEIISFISKCADYIIEHIGSGDGQKEITDASRNWLGLNSSSILEPMVRLYRLTSKTEYLDFAGYIVKCGGAKGINIFRLAYENQLYPYQYGIPKAYEMMSCFEGLLEYYYATGIEWCKTAVINFANAIMKTELSVIGSCGITNELFDYTAARQTVRQEDVLQETCVTVTWMKLCGKLLELTGDSRYADCMEQSFYNAYLGALNTQGRISPFMRKRYVEERGVSLFKDTLLPVDSYSPLLSGMRGVCVGGGQLLADGSYYGCCASIASAGVGVFVSHMLTADDHGITINFFEAGKASLNYQGIVVEIAQETDYPVGETVRITVKTDVPKEFELRVRLPGWTGETGYKIYQKEWSEDTLELQFPMPLRTQFPQKWEQATVYTPNETTVYHDPKDDNYIALFRGPVALAVDSKLGKAANSIFDFEPAGELCAEKGPDCLVKMRFFDRKGTPFYLIDYASSGKDWESEIAVWLQTK